LDITSKIMHFDVVLSFNIKPEEGIKILHEELHKAYPEYEFEIVPDVDVSTTE